MRKDAIAIICLVLFGAVLYGLTLRGAPGTPTAADFKDKLDLPTGAFELSPERGRYVQTVSLAERGTYALDRTWALVAYPDVGVSRAGKTEAYFSFFAPGVSYMALPFYLLGRYFGYAQVGAFSLEAILTVLSLAFVFLIGRRIFGLSRGSALFASLLFGFGSTAWSYAVTFYQHSFTTFFIASSVYMVWKFGSAKGKWSFLYPTYVWAAYGLAIFVDYPNVILMLPVMIYLFLSTFSIKSLQDGYKLSVRFSAIAASVAFIVITGLHFWHNAHYFGSWKQLSGGLPSYRSVMLSRASSALPATLPSSDGMLPSIGSKGSAALATTSTATSTATSTTPGNKDVVAFFRERQIPHSFYVLTVSDERGLLFFMPVFFLSILGIISFWRKKGGLSMPYAIMAALVATNVFLYSSWGDPWGGWAYGPRYLIPSMPWLSLFAAWFISQGRYVVTKKIIAFVLFLFSSGIALMGALTTNAVPPKAEALLLPIKSYNYLKNFAFLRDDYGGNFFYNTFLSGSITLIGYFIILYVTVAIAAAVALFVLPPSTDHD